MTDYLELLLDIWQEEDEAEPFVWKRKGTGYRGLSGENDVLPQVTGREKHGAELTGGQGREERLWAENVPAKGGTADPEMRLAELERAVARGRVQQVAQGWRRERTETVQQAGRQDMRRLAVAAPGVQRGLAGLLDAVFERDARRYDGPLGLF